MIAKRYVAGAIQVIDPLSLLDIGIASRHLRGHEGLLESLDDRMKWPRQKSIFSKIKGPLIVGGVGVLILLVRGFGRSLLRLHVFKKATAADQVPDGPTEAADAETLLAIPQTEGALVVPPRVAGAVRY